MSKPTVLVVFGKSWGAIDWILPVLHRLRETDSARVVAYFRQEDAYSQAPRFRDLASLFDATVEQVFTANKLLNELSLREKLLLLIANCLRDVFVNRRFLLGWVYFLVQLACLPFARNIVRSNKLHETLVDKILRKRLPDHHVQWILQDFDNRSYAAFYQAFPAAEIFVFPHGTNWWDKHQFEEKTYQAIKTIPPRATWLTGRAGDETIHRSIGLACTVAPLGHPKFDPAWIQEMITWSRKNRAQDQPAAKKPALTMLLLTRSMKRLADKRAFRDYAQGVFRVAARHGIHVAVKLHPTQKRGEIEELLAGLAERPTLSYVEIGVLCAAATADFVVAWPSSAVMDAVLAGTPVLEYFDCRNADFVQAAGMGSFIEAGGQMTSIYRHEQLVLPVDDEASFDQVVTRLVESTEYREDLAAEQHSILDELVPNRRGVIDRITGLILRSRANPTKAGQAA